MSEYLFKVLAADDEYWICESLRNMILWEEYSFQFMKPAYDGEDALQKIREDPPDILITDINMPFIGGIELIKKVKTLYPDIVILVLSGYSDFNYVREALLAGAADYLLKPIAKNNLVTILTKSLDIIGGNRADKKEKEKAKEKLQIASSVLLDKELSHLIRESRIEMETGGNVPKISEYELDFAGFSLVMFKTCNLNQIMKRNVNADINQISFQIKSKITEAVQPNKHIVFNNIYVSNQFILLADMDSERLSKVSDLLIQHLEEYTGAWVSASVSGHYFSFTDLKAAYHEALLAQMARVYRRKSEKICAKDIGGSAVKKRMTTEQENQLVFAVQNNDAGLIRRLIFESIALPDCVKNEWRFIEVKQTIDSIVRIFAASSERNYSSADLMAFDNFSELLGIAFDACDISGVCSILDQMIDEFFGSADPSAASDTMRKTVKLAQEYIHQNYFTDISLFQLSKKFLVDRSYLCKAFKQETGENIMLYLSKVRIEKAKEFMQQDQLNITKISQLVGYDDYGYFNRVFRKITGISPREYKNSLDLE